MYAKNMVMHEHLQLCTVVALMVFGVLGWRTISISVVPVDLYSLAIRVVPVSRSQPSERNILFIILKIIFAI